MCGSKECYGPQKILYDLHQFPLYHGQVSLDEATDLMSGRPDGSYLLSNLDTSLEDNGIVKGILPSNRGVLMVYYKEDGCVKFYRSFYTSDYLQSCGLCHLVFDNYINVGPWLSLLCPDKARFMESFSTERKFTNKQFWKDIVKRELANPSKPIDLPDPCTRYRWPLARKGVFRLSELAMAKVAATYCAASISSLSLPKALKKDISKVTISPNYDIQRYDGFLCEPAYTNFKLSLEYA